MLHYVTWCYSYHTFCYVHTGSLFAHVCLWLADNMTSYLVQSNQGKLKIMAWSWVWQATLRQKPNTNLVKHRWRSTTLCNLVQSLQSGAMCQVADTARFLTIARLKHDERGHFKCGATPWIQCDTLTWFLSKPIALTWNTKRLLCET